jgi:peptide/nickel transport system substrate-binding protein
VTWKLKKGVTWHDGKPFTADDVRLHLGIFARSRDRDADQRLLQDITVEKIDPHTRSR